MLKQVAVVITLLLVITSGCSNRESKPDEPNEPTTAGDLQPVTSKPRYAAQLACYIGEIGSRSHCSTIINDPNKKTSANVTITSQSIRCGYPSQVSEISWKFVEHKDNKDIYSFERMFPVDTNEYTLTSEVVEFEGKQTTIFQDEYQVIVLDIPR